MTTETEAATEAASLDHVSNLCTSIPVRTTHLHLSVCEAFLQAEYELDRCYCQLDECLDAVYADEEADATCPQCAIVPSTLAPSDASTTTMEPEPM